MRELRGLRWARALGEKPECIPKGRPRGVKAKGIRFEGAVAAGCPEAVHGLWWEFEDAEGRGFAQTDLVWRLAGRLVVGEAKLTWRREAYVQLRKWYFPILTAAFGLPVGGVVICRNVTRETPQAEVVGELLVALDRARGGSIIPTLHLPLVGA